MLRNNAKERIMFHTRIGQVKLSFVEQPNRDSFFPLGWARIPSTLDSAPSVPQVQRKLDAGQQNRSQHDSFFSIGFWRQDAHAPVWRYRVPLPDEALELLWSKQLTEQVRNIFPRTLCAPGDFLQFHSLSLIQRVRKGYYVILRIIMGCICYDFVLLQHLIGSISDGNTLGIRRFSVPRQRNGKRTSKDRLSW